MSGKHEYNGSYSGDYLNRIAFPLGGIGAGMICLEGTGALSHVSVRNAPEIFNEPLMFAALCVKGETNEVRLLEGPVPTWKAFGPAGSGNGRSNTTYGFPRFETATFQSRFPFATVELSHAKIPVKVTLTGWSPFIPNNADDSSLPMAALEYLFENTGTEIIDAVFSFQARNFMATETPGQSVGSVEGGFVLRQAGSTEAPWDEGTFAVASLEPEARADCAWFRGGWFDSLTMLWRTISAGRPVENPSISAGNPSPGGSVYVPFTLAPGARKMVRLMLTWYVPKTNLRILAGVCDGKRQDLPTHKPWYAGRFDDIEGVMNYARVNYARLYASSESFSDCFYDTTLPPEVSEAIAANLTILKSPTVLRQADGRLWCWEGCCDTAGCCSGSCTHVWNYAQALPHLFPELERILRQAEFNECQDERGHQAFRASLPIGPVDHTGHAAADGQLGGIMKIFREWRISGNDEWLKAIWPKVKASLDYCIETWDPDRIGVLVEPHHNTYDIEFWGPDGMCGSFYLGALRAASLMAKALGENASHYEVLYDNGKKYLETELFNGDYFIQKIMWQNLRAGEPTQAKTMVKSQWSPEGIELAKREGPKYQYGTGCLTDGVLGAWMAKICGVGEILDPAKVKSHLLSVYRNNLRKDLSDHANPQRPSYALGKDGGLLVCTWPKGSPRSLPLPYSDEVWTGAEYAAASHLMMMGCVEEGLEIVRTARDRYDGRVRNPFNEYECGHWYARAMSSYGLLQGLTGVRYDAGEHTLYLEPKISGDFRCFLCTTTGYGAVGIKDGKPFVEMKEGRIEIAKTRYTPCEEEHRDG